MSFFSTASENGSISDESDHEEEFYYTEVEEYGDEDSATMQSFNDTLASSSPSQAFSFPIQAHQMLATNAALDHDYQRKVSNYYKFY
jgi:hypothetical protein